MKTAGFVFKALILKCWKSNNIRGENDQVNDETIYELSLETMTQYVLIRSTRNDSIQELAVNFR